MKFRYILALILVLIGIKFSVITVGFFNSTEQFIQVNKDLDPAISRAINDDTYNFEIFKDQYIGTGITFIMNLLKFGTSAGTGLTCLIVGVMLFFEQSSELLYEFFTNLFEYIFS